MIRVFVGSTPSRSPGWGLKPTGDAGRMKRLQLQAMNHATAAWRDACIAKVARNSNKEAA